MKLKKNQYIFLPEHYLCQVESCNNSEQIYDILVINGRWQGKLHMKINAIEIPPQEHFSGDDRSTWHQLPKDLSWQVVTPSKWSVEEKQYWYFSPLN